MDQRESGGIRHKALLHSVLLCVLGIQPVVAQAPSTPLPPEEVVAVYRRMDAAGERLTESGWYRASEFFLKPGRPPQNKVVEVIESERVTGRDPWRQEPNKAEVAVICSAVGHIDSLARFSFEVSPSPGGRGTRRDEAPITGPTPLERRYTLVLTDTYWEFVRGQENLREMKGPPRWRIADFETEPWVTVDTGIRYLRQMRNQSPSAVIKSNANKSIATLERLLASPERR
jgi:hypothetical protein